MPQSGQPQPGQPRPDGPGGSPARFAALLVARRHEAGLTQEELAARSGVSARTISDLERGFTTGPQRRSVELLGEALGLTGAGLAEFLGAARSRRSRPAAATAPGAPAGSGCSLPIDVADFRARQQELTRLRAVAELAAAETGTAQLAAISGQPGVGKTALAVHASHQLGELFPDGQWYVDLRGMDERPLTVQAALGRLLRALGQPEDRIPAQAEDRENLYRSLTHGRRLLLVLDNAADEAQVRPLLLAGDRCLTLITSRRVLAGLAAVHRLLLDVLASSSAVGLLGDIVGDDRLAGEPVAAREVARLCGGLPLALRIAGNRLASRPSWTIGFLASQLGDERRRLELLVAGDLEMRAAFGLSGRQLTGPAQLVFRRLALVPGPDFGADLAAVTAGLGLAEAETTLDEVADASLIEPAPTPGRYRFHDLVRLFAAEQLTDSEEPAERQAAAARMVTALTGAVISAGLLIDPPEKQHWTAGPPDRSLAAFTTQAEAVSWLDTEFANWFGAVRQCAADGRHTDILAVASVLDWYSDMRSHRGEWAELFQLALAAAHQFGDRRHVIAQLNNVGWSCGITGQWDTAIARHRQALAVARETGDRLGEARSLALTGMALAKAGRGDEAIPLLTSAVELYEEVGDPSNRCMVRMQLGFVTRRSGHAEQAISHLDIALALAAEMDYPPMQAMILAARGQALASLGRLAQAAASFRAAIPVWRENGDLVGLARNLTHLGRTELAQGHRDEASASLREAFEVCTRMSDQQGQEEILRLLEQAQNEDPAPATLTSRNQSDTR